MALQKHAEGLVVLGAELRYLTAHLLGSLPSCQVKSASVCVWIWWEERAVNVEQTERVR